MKKVMMDDSKYELQSGTPENTMNEAQDRSHVRVKPVRAVLNFIYGVLLGNKVRIILHLRSDVMRTTSIYHFLHIPSKDYSRMSWSFLKMKNKIVEVHFSRSLGTNRLDC